MKEEQNSSFSLRCAIGSAFQLPTFSPLFAVKLPTTATTGPSATRESFDFDVDHADYGSQGVRNGSKRAVGCAQLFSFCYMSLRTRQNVYRHSHLLVYAEPRRYGIFRSKIEVKSCKSFAEGIFYLCRSILFFTFEQCVNVSKHSCQVSKPSDVSGGIFFPKE